MLGGLPNLFGGGNRPTLPGLGGPNGLPDPLGLGGDHGNGHGPGGNGPPGLDGGLPPGLAKPYDGGPNPGGNVDPGHRHGGDHANAGNGPSPSGTPPSTPDGAHTSNHNTPNVVSSGSPIDDQIAAYPSRLLPGQSAHGASSAQAFNQATQYPAPTLSERALSSFAASPAAMNRADAVPANVNVLQAAPNQTAALPTPVASAQAASQAQAAAPALAMPPAHPNAVPAAPMAAMAHAESLAAQQSLLNQLAMLQKLGQPPTAAAANAAAAHAENATAPNVIPLTVNTSANDPRGLPTALNDRVQLLRGDSALNGGAYLGEGPLRRPLGRGARVDAASLTYWLWTLGRGGVHRPTHENQPNREVLRALQWLFWLLTVVAYACLATALIMLLPTGELVSDRVATAGGGGALMIGVVVAAGAWLVGRRLNRRG